MYKILITTWLERKDHVPAATSVVVEFDNQSDADDAVTIVNERARAMHEPQIFVLRLYRR